MQKELLETAFGNIVKTEFNYVQTGFANLDIHLKYLNKGSIIAVGSEMIYDMNYLILNLTEKFSQSGKKCLYFSFRHPADTVVQKLLKLHSGVIIRETFNKPKKITPKNIKKLETAKNEMRNWNLHVVDESSMCIEDFEKIIEEIKPDYVFIDAIQSFPLNNMPIKYFAEHLKKTAKYKKFDYEECNVINNASKNLLEMSRFNNENKITKVAAKKILEEDIEYKLPIKVYDAKMPYLRWENFASEYILQNIKPIAAKNDIVVFIDFYTYDQELNIENIKDNINPSILKDVCDTIIFLEYGNMDAHCGDNKSNNWEMCFKVYKGNAGIIGSSGGLVVDYTGKIKKK